jgi:hypothetical protein
MGRNALRAGLTGVVFSLAYPQAVPVVAQELAMRLTGGTSRVWVFKRIVRSMGADDGCTSGETYTFEQVGRGLAIRECKDGNLVVSRYSWRLAQAAPSDTSLVVDGLGTFVLLFRDTDDGSRFMRLRTRGRTPTQPTIDKEFRLIED